MKYIILLLFILLCNCRNTMTVYVKDISQIDTLENGMIKINGPAVIKPERTKRN